MALTTPIVQPLSPFPSNVDQLVQFSAIGGNQIVGNTLKIYKVSDNSLVYTNSITSFLLQNTINANSLTNGIVYKATITTKDINNNSSAESDPVVFYVLSNAVLTIINIDSSGQVYNQNVTFSCTYSQAEGELLQSYIYNLYDHNQSLIQSYPNVFANGSSPLTQLISGLANNTLYYAQVKTVSIHGQLGDSGLIPFTPIYVAPALYSTLTTTPVPTTGSVQISAIILQETGQMDSGTAIYQDSTWIDLTQGGQVSFQNGFAINQPNFIAKIWCKNIPLDTVFCTIYAPNGKIELHMESDQVHAYVYLNGSTVYNHFISNILLSNILTNQAFMIYIKSQYYLLDLYLTLV